VICLRVFCAASTNASCDTWKRHQGWSDTVIEHTTNMKGRDVFFHRDHGRFLAQGHDLGARTIGRL
jgi:hypothetical protein